MEGVIKCKKIAIISKDVCPFKILRGFERWSVLCCYFKKENSKSILDRQKIKT